MSQPEKDIKIIHRKNKLKVKAGGEEGSTSTGYIDPEAVKRGQHAIDKEEENYANEAEIVLLKIDSTWDDLKGEKDDAKRKGHLNTLYNYANNIKDIAETFNYDLMSYFGKSLRDFCEKIDTQNEAHHTIVNAHIDVMWAAYKNNLKTESTPAAEELKLILNKAIEKHS